MFRRAVRISRRMKTTTFAASLAAASLVAVGFTFVLLTDEVSHARDRGDSPDAPSVASAPEPAPVDRIAAGRHLIRIAGCNDCHTPGYLIDPDVPESEWLTGVPVGWRGPWGTTYASNLRRHIATFSDPETWIRMIRARNGLPPMPWASLHAMTDEELRSIHAYIGSLPVAGEFMPPVVGPDQSPSTPYLNLVPVAPE